jgi:hypothetical protein
MLLFCDPPHGEISKGAGVFVTRLRQPSVIAGLLMAALLSAGAVAVNAPGAFAASTLSVSCGDTITVNTTPPPT